VSQYHAAEHMVVHALENLEPLSVSSASRMPRVHPRCGSNIVIVLVIFFLAVFPPFDWRWAAGALLLLPLARQLGGLAQHWFSTRTPGPQHLRSALRAAEAMLRNYAAHPSRRVTLLSRLWFSGLLHTAAGAAGSLALFHFLESLLLQRGLL